MRYQASKLANVPGQYRVLVRHGCTKHSCFLVLAKAETMQAFCNRCTQEGVPLPCEVPVLTCRSLSCVVLAAGRAFCCRKFPRSHPPSDLIADPKTYSSRTLRMQYGRK